MAKQSTPENESPKKPNRVLPIILGLVLLGGIFFGVKEYIYYGKHVDTDDAQIDGDISPVVARIGGYVDSVMFQENTHVNRGDVLIKIDDRDYRVKLEQAQSAQVGASSGIGVNQSQIFTGEANSAVAKANVQSAGARLDKVNKDYQRYANLIKDGSITQQQFDQAKSDLEVAQANLQATKDQYKAAQEQISTTRSQKQVDVDFAKLQLSYAIIKAPASGITSKKNVQLGQLIQAGQTLFSIVNDSSLFITANFKETQLDKIKDGLKVNIDIDAYPEMKLTGTVYNFAPATGAKFSLLPPDNATGNYVKVVQRIPVKIKINADKDVMAKLRPGMSVNVSVIIKD
jgi:membrane fusion protein (multidrug efflux system)